MSSTITFDTGIITVNGVNAPITATIVVDSAVSAAVITQFNAIDNLIVNGVAGQLSAAVEPIITSTTPGTITLGDPPFTNSNVAANFTQQTYAYFTGPAGSTINLPSYNATNGNGFSGMIVDVAGAVTVNGGSFKAGRVVLGAQSDVTFDPQGGAPSASTIIGGGGNNNLTLDSKNYTVLLAGGDNTVTANAYFGSTGTPTFNDITTDAGKNLIRLNAGTDIITSAGTDTIFALTNNATISVSGAGSYVGLNKVQSGAMVTATGINQTINVNGTNDSVDASNIGAGSYVFVNGSANDVTLGAAGNVLVGPNGSANTITGGAGAPVADFGTHDMVSMTGGLTYEYGNNSTLTASNSARVYANGTGNVVNLTGNAIGAGTMTGGIFNASDATHLSLGGKNAGNLVNLSGTATAGVNGDSVVTSGNNLVASYSNNNDVTVGGTNAALFTFGGTINATVTGSATVSIFENGGSATLVNTGTGSTVANQGAGSVTVTAGAGTATLFGGTGGNNFLTGGSSGANFLAASGNSTLIAGGGATTLVGSTGAVSMAGSSAAGATNLFSFASLATGAATISGFAAANGSIVLQDGLTVSSITPASGSQTISLSNGGSIDLFGFSGTLTSATAAGGITTLT